MPGPRAWLKIKVRAVADWRLHKLLAGWVISEQDFKGNRPCADLRYWGGETVLVLVHSFMLP